MPEPTLSAGKNAKTVKNMDKLRSRELPCVLQKGTTSRESFAATKCSHFFKNARLSFGSRWEFIVNNSDEINDYGSENGAAQSTELDVLSRKLLEKVAFVDE